MLVLELPKVYLYTSLILLFFVLEKVYFRIAKHYHIIDSPNYRSSHTEVTIVGGGIIFPIAAIIGIYFGNGSYPYFLAGLLVVTVLSFWDDLVDLPYRWRTPVQILAVVMLILQLQLQVPFYWSILIAILIVGTINAYNFMDGINGIAGAYSLVTLGTLFYLNHFVVHFTKEIFLDALILGTLVFNFFNFRTKAKCFAGDVGSVSMAFSLSFLLIQLIDTTHNFLFVGLLLLYGLDTVTTIVFRLFRKENIFEAHRSHFYQFLVNERKWTHLSVSFIYSLIQLVINIGIVMTFVAWHPKGGSVWGLLQLILFSGLAFAGIRFLVEGPKYLFGLRAKEENPIYRVDFSEEQDSLKFGHH